MQNCFVNVIHPDIARMFIYLCDVYEQQELYIKECFLLVLNLEELSPQYKEKILIEIYKVNEEVFKIIDKFRTFLSEKFFIINL